MIDSLGLSPTDQNHSGAGRDDIGLAFYGRGVIRIVKVLWSVLGRINNPVPTFVTIQTGNVEAQGLGVGIKDDMELLPRIWVAQGKG
jgi:hypothetical protein